MIGKIRSGEIRPWQIPEYLYAELLEEGEDEIVADAIDIAGNAGHRQQSLLLQYANLFKKSEVLFDLIISVYTNDGYNFPKRLILLAKQISKRIPKEHRLEGLPEGDPVIVYRGCSAINPDTITKRFIKTEISWTTDKTEAIWFANRISNPNSKNGKGGVWQATIQRDKIIAFTQARNESEVIQHMNVKDPHIIDVSPEEWEAALKHQVEERQRQYDQLLKGGTL